MSATSTSTPRAQAVPKGPLLTLLGTVFISLMGVGFVVPFLPVLAKELGASGFALGLLMAGFSLSMGIFQPLAGALSDRHGRKRFLAVGLGIYAACGFSYTLANTVLDLTIIRLIQGVGAATVFPVAMAYMADWAPPRQEGRYMGAFNVALMGGIGSGPLLGGLLNDSFGISAAFYAMGAASALALLLTLIVLPESRSGQASEDTESLPRVFREILADRRMRGVLMVRFSVMLAMVPSFIFVPVLMNDVMGSSGTQIGIVITFRTLVSASLQFPFGWLADRYSRPVLAMISVLGVAAVVSWVGLATEFWHILGLFILMGIVEALFLPTTSAMAMEGGRSFGMGSIMGVFNSAMNVGMVVGSLGAGLLIDAFGFDLSFIIIGAAVASSGLIAGAMLRTPTKAAGQSAPVSGSVEGSLGLEIPKPTLTSSSRYSDRDV